MWYRYSVDVLSMKYQCTTVIVSVKRRCGTIILSMYYQCGTIIAGLVTVWYRFSVGKVSCSRPSAGVVCVSANRYMFLFDLVLER